MPKTTLMDPDPLETVDWIKSMEEVFQREGPARAQFLLGRLIKWGKTNGVVLPFSANTSYQNTIPVVWFVGMRWLWWCEQIARVPASVVTSRPTHRAQRCTRWR